MTGLLRAIALLVACLSGAAQAATPSSPASPVDAALQRPVGAHAWEGFPLANALRKASRGEEAAALERYLFDAFLAETAEGRAQDRTVTAAQAIDLGRQLAPIETGDLPRRWKQAAGQNLALVWPEATPALPNELEADAASLVSLAPGLFSGAGERPRTVYLLPTLRNAGAAPWPVLQFKLRLYLAPNAPLMFACSPPRERTQHTLAPAAAAPFICRSEAPLAPDVARRAADALQMARTQPQLVAFEAQELSGASLVERTSQAFSALNPGAVRALEAPPPVSTPVRTAAPPAKKADVEAGKQAAKQGQAWMYLLMAVAATAGYFGVAGVIGNGRAALLAWLVGTGYAVSFIARGPSIATGESWAGLAYLLIYLYALGAPILAAAALYTLYHYTVEDREAGRKALLEIMLGTLLRLLLSLLPGRRAR